MNTELIKMCVGLAHWCVKQWRYVGACRGNESVECKAGGHIMMFHLLH